MLRLAGCSSGRGVCARGGWAARRGRVYWGVLRPDYVCRAVLLRRFMFDHACCLPQSAKQDGLRYLAFLFRRGSGSPLVRSRMSCGYRTLLVHFELLRFFAAIPTEDEETRRTELAARRECAFA